MKLPYIYLFIAHQSFFCHVTASHAMKRSVTACHAIRHSLSGLHFLIPAAIFILFLSCQSGNSSRESGNAQMKAEGAEAGFHPDSISVPDMHTSRIALDYAGLYTGVLPCASCEGIDTRIRLYADGRFEMDSRYLGVEGNPEFSSEGDYTWMPDGNTIRLEGVDPPNLYHVGENQLFKLDMQGSRVSGPLSEMYRLNKTEPAPGR